LYSEVSTSSLFGTSVMSTPSSLRSFLATFRNATGSGICSRVSRIKIASKYLAGNVDFSSGSA
jgi:hypothetical protein